MILVIVTAMCACLAIGYLIGWLAHSDRAERAARQADYPPSAAPRHAQTMPLRLRHVAPGTDEMRALSAAAGFPALAAQPPLRELVHAARTTEVIEKMRADTDRWLAARGLEDAQ